MKYIAHKHDPALLGRNAKEVGVCDMISRVHDSWYNELSKHGKSGDSDVLLESIDFALQFTIGSGVIFVVS